MKAKIIAVSATLCALLATVANADILEWNDADGVRHFTNLKGEVPRQQTAQVVVDEQVWLPQESSVPAAEADPVVEPDPVAQADPPRDTEDSAFRAYLAGLESGLASNANTGGSVYINGPLAVTVSSATPYSDYGLPGYGSLPGYYWGPFVTTPLIGKHRGPFRGPFRDGAHRRFSSHPFSTPAGPSPFGAPGPPPFGAAGPPPFGAAGPPPLGAAGIPPMLSATRTGFLH